MVAAEGGFHGRTMGALALTSKAAYREPFEPLPGDVTFVPYGDARRAGRRGHRRDRRDPARADPGRGRRRRPARGLPRGRPRGSPTSTARCSGSTRSRPAWAAPARGSPTTPAAGTPAPDIVTVAKGLGGGFPIGACIGLGAAGDLLQPGNHGTTFGGNPVACAAALAVIGTIEDEGLLEHVTVLGQKLRDGLAADPRVTEVRGEGLLIGLDLAEEKSAEVFAAALDAGFIVNNPTPSRIRLAPPLVLTEADADAPSSTRGRRSSTRRGLSMTRHFLADDDLTPGRAGRRSSTWPPSSRPRRTTRGRYAGPQSVAMIFDKPTLRTQVVLRAPASPSSAATRCWSRASWPASASASRSRTSPGSSAGRSSTIVWRTFAQADLELMAEHAGVPVVNALTDEFHPCQLLADLLTVREHKGELAGLTVTFVGDAACNMGNSWLLAGVTAGMHVRVAGPRGLPAGRGDVRARRRHRRRRTGGSADRLPGPGRGREREPTSS